MARYTKMTLFNPFDVSKWSVGACILCEWVLALQKSAMQMDQYSLTPMGLIRNRVAETRGLSIEFLRSSRGKKFSAMDEMLSNHYHCDHVHTPCISNHKHAQDHCADSKRQSLPCSSGREAQKIQRRIENSINQQQI